MTFFQFKQRSFINSIIYKIVDIVKTNAKGQCFFVNLTNPNFWEKIEEGEEILNFFNGMKIDQRIEFIQLFSIFKVDYHGKNPYFFMTANPESPMFQTTLNVSIKIGYNAFIGKCSQRANSPIEGDLRCSISPSPVQQTSSDFLTGLSAVGKCFGGGPATQPFSQISYPRDPACSVFSNIRTVMQPTGFIPLSATDVLASPFGKPNMQLKIVKGRVVRVEIPSGCTTGPSTSSTVGIAKSPRTPTPKATTILKLEKKIAKLLNKNPVEGSSEHLELSVSIAKLEKLQASL